MTMGTFHSNYTSTIQPKVLKLPRAKMNGRKFLEGNFRKFGYTT